MTLARFKIPMVEFPPMQIKLAVAGFGHAEKDEVLEAVMRELNLEGTTPARRCGRCLGRWVSTLKKDRNMLDPFGSQLREVTEQKYLDDMNETDQGCCSSFS